MAITTCPFPENINPLSPNGFMFQIEKLPDLTYFCQQITLPTVLMTPSEQSTPFTSVPFRGNQLEYGDLSVQFLVDSEMKNYKAVNNWLTEGFPENTVPGTATYSDAFIHILGPSNQIIQTIQFTNLTPSSIEGITLSSTNTDVQYLVCNATFQYTYYKFI